MKRIVALALLTAVLAGAAQAGTEVGFRVGYSDMKGGIFKGSGDVGGVALLGLQAVIPILPRMTLSVAGERRSETIRFEDVGDAGDLFHGEAEWSDLALFAALRLRILPLIAGPFGVYAGAGLGGRFTETSIKPMMDEITDGIRDFVRRNEEDRSAFSWHGLVGASLKLPILPVTAFAESRFEKAEDSYTPRAFSVYGGVNLSLP